MKICKNFVLLYLFYRFGDILCPVVTPVCYNRNNEVFLREEIFYVTVTNPAEFPG